MVGGALFAGLAMDQSPLSIPQKGQATRRDRFGAAAAGHPGGLHENALSGHAGHARFVYKCMNSIFECKNLLLFAAKATQRDLAFLGLALADHGD